jgi:hypothetical protein
MTQDRFADLLASNREAHRDENSREPRFAHTCMQIILDK